MAIAGLVHGDKMLLMSPLDREPAMNTAYFSAFAALAGSAIGALGGVVTTWDHIERAAARPQVHSGNVCKESLYAEFIEESSKLTPTP